MGAHKHNPTAIAAKNGELPPKPKPKYSKREMEAMMANRIREVTGINWISRTMGGPYL